MHVPVCVRVIVAVRVHVHGYEGVELDTHHLTRTLPHVYHIWGRPVHLETVEAGRPVRYTCDGEDVQRRPL